MGEEDNIEEKSLRIFRSVQARVAYSTQNWLFSEYIYIEHCDGTKLGTIEYDMARLSKSIYLVKSIKYVK